jgi:outer membrane protein assembly factor BamD
MKKVLVILFISVLFACATKQATLTPEAVYKEATEAFRNKDYPTSIESFKKVKELFPEHPLAQLSQLEIAEVHFNAQEYDEAALAYDEFIRLYPGNINIPYARYKEALCYYNQISQPDRDQSATRKAIEKFEKIIKDYPDTPYAVKSYEYLKFCRKRLAEQEIFVANFYLKSEKYNAAEKRFLYVLKFFYDVEVQQDALLGLYNLYKITGQTTKAEDIKRTMEFFFPYIVVDKKI